MTERVSLPVSYYENRYTREEFGPIAISILEMANWTTYRNHPGFVVDTSQGGSVPSYFREKPVVLTPDAAKLNLTPSEDATELVLLEDQEDLYRAFELISQIERTQSNIDREAFKSEITKIVQRLVDKMNQLHEAGNWETETQYRRAIAMITKILEEVESHS